MTAAMPERELGVPDIGHARHGDPDELRLCRWREEAETEHDLLVLQAEAAPSGRSRRCVERVDHLVLVAPGLAGNGEVTLR